MKITLEVKKGYRADEGKRFEIVRAEPDNVTVGRSARKSEKQGDKNPHIQVSADDLRLSRWHFMLMIRPPNCYIGDLGSANHTYKNNFEQENYIKEEVELKDGNIIKGGRTYLKVRIVPDELEESPQYFCIKCNKELKGLEGKPLERIGAEDFVCDECKRKKPHIWVPEEERKEEKGKSRKEKPKKQDRKEAALEEKEEAGERTIVSSEESEKISASCFNCNRDLTGQANRDGRSKELRDVALYLCKDCALSERKEKEEIDDYVFLMQIGIGGMGVVYKVWHKPTGRIVVIKEILPDKLMDERSLKVFHREISITRDLVHPHIVRFYTSFSGKGKPYLVTEYLPGGNAEEKVLRQKGPLAIKEACRIILEVLEGLSFAHRRGIVHRDVTPQNILFDRNGRAKLSDMGLAKSFELAGQSGITAPGDTGGKILYMPPEQILDFCFVKPPADVYSVGVCLYYFLTGKFPYHFPTSLEVLMGLAGLMKVKSPFAIVIEDDPIPILERKPDLSKPLGAVIDRCLKKKPEERFKDGGELKEAIRKLL